MGNNTPDSKLDETIKNSLNEYEAQYDPSDWSRMESMLDAAPKSGNFKWSHAVSVMIGVAVIGGGYLLYNAFSGPEEPKTEVSSNPVPEEKKQETPVTVSPPPSSTTPPAVKEPVPAPVVVTPEKNEAKQVLTEKTGKETVPAVEPKIKNKKGSEKTTEPIIDNNDKILRMGNEPIFGDMLDSSKGIVGETREKEETKKAAKAKKNTPVGWDQFMLPNVNADSLRKYRERRDTLKSE
jgi:hypothetical protein